MATIEAGRERRLDSAIEALRNEIRTLADRDRASLVVTSPAPAVAAAPGADRAELMRALDRVDVAEVEGDLTAALALPLSITGSDEVHVRVFTDGAGGIGGDDGGRFRNVTFADLGFAERDNVGIVDLVWQEDGEGRSAALVTVSNFAEETVRADLKVAQGDNTLAEERTDLAAGGSRTVSLELADLREGPVVFALQPSDAFAGDNLALAYHRGPVPVGIVIRSDGPPDRFWLAALESVTGFGERVRIVRQDAEPEPFERRLEIDLRRDRRGEELSCAALLVGTRERVPFLTCRQVDRPVLLGWSSEHPVTRGLDFTELRLEKTDVVADGAGTVIVRTSEGPWAVAGEAGGHRFVWVGARPGEGNLHLLGSFPALVESAVRWLTSAPDGRGSGLRSLGTLTGSGALVRTGSAVPRGVGRLSYLDSRDAPARATAGDEVRPRYRVFERVGLYRLETGRERVYVAANLLSARESRIAPGPLPRGELPAATVTDERPVWGWLAAVALLAVIAQFIFGGLVRRSV